MEIKSYPEGKGFPTPWGSAQWAYKFCPGFLFVETAGHGGFMISKKWAKKNLTDEAIKVAENPHCRHPWGDNRILWYEEDCEAEIILFEMFDFLVREVFISSKVDEIKDDFIKRLKFSIKRWFPEYAEKVFIAESDSKIPINIIDYLVPVRVKYLIYNGDGDISGGTYVYKYTNSALTKCGDLPSDYEKDLKTTHMKVLEDQEIIREAFNKGFKRCLLNADIWSVCIG